MKIRAERDDLADVFSRAGRAIGARSPLPILQGLLLVVEGSVLHVTGTDLEVTVRTKVEVEVTEEGRSVVPGRLVTEAIRKMPAGAVEIETDDGEVRITGAGPRFRFRELPLDDYPHLPEVTPEHEVKIDGNLFADALAQVCVAASTDDARPILTGVFFEGNEGRLRLVATDSYRLAIRDLPTVKTEIAGLVPVRALRDLGRTIGSKKLVIGMGSREVKISSDRGTLTARLIEGTFPNYRQLVPVTYPSHLTVKRDDLLEAIDRASLVAEEHIPVRLQLQEGGVELSVSRQDVGGESEDVEADYKGEEMTIAFNSRYLNDGVAAVDDDEVVLDVSDPLKPGVIRGAGSPDFSYLLMPVRL